MQNINELSKYHMLLDIEVFKLSSTFSCYNNRWMHSNAVKFWGCCVSLFLQVFGHKVFNTGFRVMVDTLAALHWFTVTIFVFAASYHNGCWHHHLAGHWKVNFEQHMKQSLSPFETLEYWNLTDCTIKSSWINNDYISFLTKLNQKKSSHHQFSLRENT